ncbi:MAG: T9SS type A sorting domain-containing protein [Sphingobacteriales bacterium]|nr:MAG: T9SS type A sorting domain-containing protein [Sphingobacteriales bacterium]
MKHQTPAVCKTALTALLTFLLLPLLSKADITTYHWQQDLKGFNIEAIPGTSPTEYIAIGTVYYRTNIGGQMVNEGIHFMHLNDNGNILCDRTFYIPETADGYYTLMAVDVAVENPNSFWATLQYRGDQLTPGHDRDGLYVVNFDASCNIVKNWVRDMNGLTTDVMNEGNIYTHTYPTHSLFHNGFLYVCGYLGPKWHGYPIAPNTFASEKLGFVLKLDVNDPMGLQLMNSYVWDSPQMSGFPYDYDVPHKIKLNSRGNIMVVGAANSSVDNQCNIMAMELQPNNLNPIRTRVLRHATPLTDVGHVLGIYGIDIREDRNTGDYYILSNHYNGSWPYKWSETRVDFSLSASALPSMIGMNKSEFPAYGDSYFGNMIFDDGTVYGQQMNTVCGATVPAPHINPSLTNVDPFLSFPAISYNNLMGIQIASVAHKLQMSINGTTWLYLGGGSAMDIFPHMFTPVIPDPAGSGYKMIAPVKDNGSGKLNAKFISTDPAGDETQCNTTYDDCEEEWTTEYVINDNTISRVYPPWETLVGADVDIDVLPVAETDCTGGEYKPASDNTENERSKKSRAVLEVYTKVKKDFNLYPNPAVNGTNISFSLTEAGKVNVQVLDALGRVVSNVAETQYEKGYHRITVSTTELAAGIYIIKLQTTQQTLTRQLTVTK